MNPYNSYNKNQIRVNQRIRATEVRVIDEKGGQVGILPISSALKLATERGLDLVEVASDARPPVCRIVDFGKYRYEQAKKGKGEGKHSHASKLKELKFHVTISEHDYETKLRHATDFLSKGMRVKLSVFFRGREMQHQEYGMQLVRRAIQDLKEHGHTDSDPRLLGKNLHVVLVPGKAKPRQSPQEGGSSGSHSHPSSSESPKGFGTSIKIDLKPSSVNSK
jgi:translation initiation factor IF-3